MLDPCHVRIDFYEIGTLYILFVCVMKSKTTDKINKKLIKLRMLVDDIV